MFDYLLVAVTVYWRPLGSLVDPEAVWTRSRWTEQQSQQHDPAAPVCLDPAVSTRHHDSTQNPNTHRERERETLQRPVSSASNCSSSSSSSSGVLNMSWSNRFTAERESWWTEGPVQTVHTQEPEPESPLKSFTKLKHGLFKAILSSLLHFIDLINLTC